MYYAAQGRPDLYDDGAGQVAVAVDANGDMAALATVAKIWNSNASSVGAAMGTTEGTQISLSPNQRAVRG